MLQAAFYKGTRPGIQGFYNKITRLWLRGEYSHCEIIFSDGISASSSFLDGGVRFKNIEYKPNHWDIIELNGFDETQVREWFILHGGQKYDILGLLGFIFRILNGHPKKWVCSEAIMEALGYKDSWRYDPCVMFSTLINRN